MRIFVGCSSRDIGNEAYNRVATEIGNFIVDSGCDFVFGGCENGLMGRIYSIVKKSGTSKIIIASVKTYLSEIRELSYDWVEILKTTNERKDAFIRLSDVMVFIPGGIGTLDELMSAIESKRSREHDHPIIILNIDNFFNKLLEMFEQVYDEKLASPQNRKLYSVIDSVDELRHILL